MSSFTLLQQVLYKKMQPLRGWVFVSVFQMRPITMKASREFPEVTVPKDYLYYKANDVVHVIDKK